jgi:hypothetical protein
MFVYIVVGLIILLPVLAIAKATSREEEVEKLEDIMEKVKLGVPLTHQKKYKIDYISAFHLFSYIFCWVIAVVALFLGDGSVAILLFGLPIVISILVASIRTLISKN